VSEAQDITPDLIFVSGRESMSMPERKALLAADVVQLEHGPLNPNYRKDCGIPYSVWWKGPDAAKCHAFNSLIAWADSAARHETSTTFMSQVECCVLAWRRGGAEEEARIKKLQRAGRKTRAGSR
jgi:hypothetical protein